ncbi:MAG: preprotein translocase subunit SecA [Firmicutes bacterium]|jgi:preprotein translocase subunit SecA|nr:preprotein translocase subunit SecA [Bacillota bacterium]
MFGFVKKILGDPNQKELNKISPYVDQINALESQMQALSDQELQNKTEEFRQRLLAGASLDELLVEAYATVREAAFRVIGQRAFDVQLTGALVLHQGRIAEMRTGEGKTLTSIFPAYLNALSGQGVHIITVNEYLAKRDCEWMGAIHRFLGLTVDVLYHGLDYAGRREAYNADITYGTNSEFGFDYLRDNMVVYKQNMVQRPLNYAIVDEVDSILIDEARTPLIISGQGDKSTELYGQFAQIARTLRQEEDYTVDEKARTVSTTESCVSKVERMLNIDNLMAPENSELYHFLVNSIKAKALMTKDVNYVVKDDAVTIVDEFTGRLMFGRRFSDGLHQAIEAKEGVTVERENQTLATITIQNYFRMYNKLSGMTGTAETEEAEFRAIYDMDVVVIPTNMPMIREDLPDVVYKTERSKFMAVVEDVVQRQATGQPVLVGTISIEKSEFLSALLKRRGIPHMVLNAKYHEMEAEIVAQAGQKDTVTIATNMAGRGTDIILGEGVKERGGLHIIGTERHESRRIDNQLRGRAGRQGDPGSSQFYISLEDDLMRLFGGDRVSSLMDTLNVDEDIPIEHNILTRAIENAQRRVEARNFDIRKHVLEYDDVMNKQREIIYGQRQQVLADEDLETVILNMVETVIVDIVEMIENKNSIATQEEQETLFSLLMDILPAENGQAVKDILASTPGNELALALNELAIKAYEKRKSDFGPDIMRQLEQMIMLRTVDSKWMKHLEDMTELRTGIGLRAYAQQDPLQAYQVEGYEMFEEMIANIRHDVARQMFQVQVRIQNEPIKREQVAKPIDPATQPSEGRKAPVKSKKKVGRNDPCPCGSGKKYKRCCGK